ncbi:MAG: PadR family transcriptional regulator [Thermoanaerobaculia bacterium]|nr:PadR family transcriptional regulator [Thermoanaerobaculia bacterium]
MQEPVESTPLTEATFLILLSLADEPKHGYAVIKDVEATSGGRVKLGTGTLYGAIKRLLELEWIVRSGESSTGGRERYEYALTPEGRRVVTEEAKRLQRLASAARRRLNPREA